MAENEEEIKPTPCTQGSVAFEPELGMKFDSFEVVQQFIKEYEDANFVKYYRNDSRTIESARRRMPKRRLDDRLRYHSVTFTCIHHGKFKSTSQGVRPKQKTMRMGCPSKIRFTATTDGEHLAIVELVTEHTHPRDEESFRALPQKRRLSDQEREEACFILEKKGKRSAQKHLKETTGKAVLMRDLHNLAANSRQQALYYSNIQAILDHLSETEDQSTTVEVVTKADGRIVGIFYQDQEMRRVYASYPHYLTVDATCKYNSLKMPLYVMLAEDANGDNEIIAIFIVVSTNVDSIRSMMLRFKEHNPTWGNIMAIMVDKDFAERRALQEEFPKASVRICLYHVLRSFKEELSKERMGLQKAEKSHCVKLMEKLAASKSEAAYMENYEQLLHTKLKKVIDYYNSSWHSNRDEWVEGLIKFRTVVLKNETSEKLESINKLLKEVFTDSPTAAQVMMKLKKVTDALREVRDHAVAALLVEGTSNETSTDDSIVHLFKQHVTPHALRHVLRQIKLSWKVRVKANASKRSCRVKSSQGILFVDKDNCPCHFYQSVCLPCRHIFAVRRYKGIPLFEKTTIGSRWSMEHYKSSCRLSAQNSSSDIDNAEGDWANLLSRQERHAKVSQITRQLANAVTNGPVEKFVDHVNTFKKLLGIIQKGSTASVTEDVCEDSVQDGVDEEGGDNVESSSRMFEALINEVVGEGTAETQVIVTANSEQDLVHKASKGMNEASEDRVVVVEVGGKGSSTKVVDVGMICENIPQDGEAVDENGVECDSGT